MAIGKGFEGARQAGHAPQHARDRPGMRAPIAHRNGVVHIARPVSGLMNRYPRRLPTPYTKGAVANQQTRHDSITVAGAALAFNQLPDYPQGRVNALEAPCGA